MAWASVVPAGGWALLRVIGWDDWYPATQLMAFTPYVLVGALVPVLVAGLLRRGWAAGAAVLVVAVLAACVVPRAVADGDPLAGARGPVLRVLTANVLIGGADAQALTRIVREQRIEVLALQELTPEFLDRAEAAGLFELLPHRAVHPVVGTEGSGVMSRYPLRDDGFRTNPGGFRQARAELTLPGGQRVLVESAHPFAPYKAEKTDLWRRSYPDQPRATADGPPRILLGDFNATLDHAPLRALIGSGYRDAADVMGQGLVGTWGPYDGDRIPPVTIDHVLADRRVGVREVRVFDLPGSDHRPVLAELVLP